MILRGSDEDQALAAHHGDMMKILQTETNPARKYFLKIRFIGPLQRNFPASDDPYLTILGHCFLLSGLSKTV